MLLYVILCSSLVCVVLCVLKLVMLKTTAQLIAISTTFGVLIGSFFLIEHISTRLTSLGYLLVFTLMMLLWTLLWLAPLGIYLKVFQKPDRPPERALVTKIRKFGWPVSFFLHILILDLMAGVYLEGLSTKQTDYVQQDMKEDCATVFLALNPLLFIMLSITISAVYGDEEVSRGERRHTTRREEELRKLWKKKFLQFFNISLKSSRPRNENSNLFINPQANMEEANICDDISDAFQINNDFTPDYLDVLNSNSVNDDANSTFNAETNAEDANNIEENPEIIDIENDLPPDYQDVIDSGLPDYHSLKN